MTVEQWKTIRQKSRTNLLWFCRHILGYEDVSRQVHGPILEALQKFQGGTEVTEPTSNGAWKLMPKSYKSNCNLWELEGSRQNLILYPRGHLKTTIVTFAHTIQWIINYPNIRVCLHTATDKQAKEFLSEIKKHFTSNTEFRMYFPEFCPRIAKNGKTEDFGNQEMFVVPNRTVERKEPTVSTLTLGSIIASGHYDVNKADDLVDKENVKTIDQIETVKQHFSMLDPLVERFNKPVDWPEGKFFNNRSWLDVSGTIYHFNDLHWSIYEDEKEKPAEKKSWHVVHVHPAPNYPLGPTLWDARWPIEEFKKIEEDPARGPEILFSQYFLNPIPAKSGLVESDSEICWIPRSELDNLLPRLTQQVTIDLAGMEGAKKHADTDYTVLNHHGFSRDGRLYINRIVRERFTDPMQVIDLMFQWYRDYPRTVTFKISKDHFARVLMPFLNKEMNKRGIWLPVQACVIDNQISKTQKILGLKPFFISRQIIWCSDVSCGKTAVINEIMRFPKYHDDILDTTIDAMRQEDGSLNMAVVGRPKTIQEVEEQKSPFPKELTWAILQSEQNELDNANGICVVSGW